MAEHCRLAIGVRVVKNCVSAGQIELNEGVTYYLCYPLIVGLGYFSYCHGAGFITVQCCSDCMNKWSKGMVTTERTVETKVSSVINRESRS